MDLMHFFAKDRNKNKKGKRKEIIGNMKKAAGTNSAHPRTEPAAQHR
jgi:hypothetical protein